jgi:hypothetical protein
MSSVFIGEGRLGNQVFQYVAMRAYMRLGRIYSPSLRALGQVFDGPDNLVPVLAEKTAERIVRRIVVPLLLRPLFKWLRFGSHWSEPVESMANGALGQSGRAVLREGFLRWVFVDGGYYQNLMDLLRPCDFRCLKLRSDVLEAAARTVSQVTAGRPLPRAVMHVRRGDYVGYKTYGLDDVLLPLSYYERAAARARDELGLDAEILVVTDDVAWCERELGGIAPFVAVSGSEAVDFALLSMFPTAILSNSTFSLAAACVGPLVTRIIGPEYWFGRSVQQWYPPKIRAIDERFVYV